MGRRGRRNVNRIINNAARQMRQQQMMMARIMAMRNAQAAMAFGGLYPNYSLMSQFMPQQAIAGIGLLPGMPMQANYNFSAIY